MVALVFDVFDAADLSGTTLGTLTTAVDKTCAVDANDFGGGSFRINRHSSEIALAAPDNYVRVKKTGGAYFGAFFIEEGGDTLISSDEDGGEDFTRGGRGPLAYLERAIVMPFRSSTGSGVLDVNAGTWSWTNPKIGAVLDDILNDAVNVIPSAVELLTWDFTATNDSNGDPWDTIDDTFQLDIGADLLSVISRFQSGGVTVRMDEDFTLHAWNDPPGAHVSGSVAFVKGTNIREAGDRQVHASPAKTRVVVQGTTVAGVTKYRTVTHPTYTSALESAIGVRYGFTQFGATPSNTMLDRAGREYLTRLKRQKDGPATHGVLNTPEPFVAYQPGDTVSVNDGTGAVNVELSSILLEDDETDGYETSISFEDSPYDPLLGVKTGSTSSKDSGGGLGGGGGSGGGGSGTGGCGSCGDCSGCAPYDPEVDCAGPGGQITDTFNRPNHSEGWGIGTGGYENGGFAPREYTDGTHGVLDTTSIANPSLPVAGPVGPTISAPGPTLFEWSAGFIGNVDETDITPTAKAWAEAHFLGYAFSPIEFGDTNFVALVVQYQPAPASATSSSIEYSIHGATGSVPVTYVKGTEYAVHIKVTATTILVEFGGAVIYTASGSFDASYNVPFLFRTSGHSSQISGVATPRIDCVSLIDWIDVVGFPGCAPRTGQETSETFTGDGSTIVRMLSQAYTSSSLRVEVNGTDVTSSVTKTDPTTGVITFAHAPKTGAEIVVTYRRA